MKTKLLLTLSLLTTLLISCASEDKNLNTKQSVKPNGASCESFWANMSPELEVRVKILTEILEGENELKGDNKKFLQSLLNEIKRNPTSDTLLLTIDKPIYPIHRLKQNQIGVLGYMSNDDFNGTWEEYAKEQDVVKGNFAYQSIDSLGVLCYFPEEFSDLYNDAPPSFYWYSLKKKNRSSFTNLGYLGNDCISYFQYDFTMSKSDETESILFGSPFSLDLEFNSFPEIDNAFKKQYAEGCSSCPTNYPDQKTFAKINGVNNLYFVYADNFPVNSKLAKPSRSLVMKMANGQVVTLWTIELDLVGCGCN
jgi:hypothetical protein